MIGDNDVKLFALLGLAVMMAAPAQAFSHHHPQAVDSHGHPIPGQTVQAPEIDPSVGMGAVLLLCGALAVLRGRRPR